MELSFCHHVCQWMTRQSNINLLDSNIYQLPFDKILTVSYRTPVMIFYLRKNYVDNIVGYNAVAYLVFPYVNIID